MLDILEGVGMPESLGFQGGPLPIHTFIFLAIASEHALVSENYSDEEFWSAYESMTDKLRPWDN